MVCRVVTRIGGWKLKGSVELCTSWPCASAKNAETTTLRVFRGELEQFHEQRTDILETYHGFCVSESQEKAGSAKGAHLGAQVGLFLE